MPIEYAVVHDRRVVVARCLGVLADGDVFSYQRTVWSRSDLAGYSEFLDTRAVTEIAAPHPANPRLAELATESAQSDSTHKAAKIGILAPGALAYGMGRMYQTQRHLEPRSTKEVGVFRTLAEVLAFLGLEDLQVDALDYQPLSTS
jgi:hypothetical protein